jgi:hypothetical protein
MPVVFLPTWHSGCLAVFDSPFAALPGATAPTLGRPIQERVRELKSHKVTRLRTLIPRLISADYHGFLSAWRRVCVGMAPSLRRRHAELLSLKQRGYVGVTTTYYVRVGVATSQCLWITLKFGFLPPTHTIVGVTTNLRRRRDDAESGKARRDADIRAMTLASGLRLRQN